MVPILATAWRAATTVEDGEEEEEEECKVFAMRQWFAMSHGHTLSPILSFQHLLRLEADG